MNRHQPYRPFTTCPFTFWVHPWPCPVIATDPCRPTACVHERHIVPRPTANYSLLTANWSFTFSAKEKDSETGLSYFGSRYYSSDLSIWLSVDPMAAKYPSLSPYTYCADNPVRLVDPNGEEIDDNLDKWKYNKTTRKLDWISNEGGKCHQIVVETENTPSGEKVNRTVEFDGAIGMMFKFSVSTPTVDGIISGALDMIGGGSTVMAGAVIEVGGSAVTGGVALPVGAAILGAGAYQMCSGLITVMDALFGSEADLYEQQDFVRDVCKSAGNSVVGFLSGLKHKPFTETLKNTVKSIGKAFASFSVSAAWSTAVRYRVTHPTCKKDLPSGAIVY